MLALLNPRNRLFLVGRNEEKAIRAAQQVASVLPWHSSSTSSSSSTTSSVDNNTARPHSWQQTVINHNVNDNIIPIVCDHSSFDSVRQFAVDLQRKLKESYDRETFGENNGIDVLCLNAATLQPKTVPAEFTDNDLETTFQTNHLSPFLLVNLIYHLLNPGGRVVVTTSGLYLMQTLELEGIPVDDATGRVRLNERFETANGVDYQCKSSYAFSKLCNVAMAVELHERLQHRGVSVACFSPGLITQTGLFRHHRDMLPFKRTRDLMLNEKTVLWGAGALVFMATSRRVQTQLPGEALYWHDKDSAKGPGAVYGNEFGPSPVSETQITVEGRKRLWALSSDLTGISETHIPLVASSSSPSSTDPSWTSRSTSSMAVLEASGSSQ